MAKKAKTAKKKAVKPKSISKKAKKASPKSTNKKSTAVKKIKKSAAAKKVSKKAEPKKKAKQMEGCDCDVHAIKVDTKKVDDTVFAVAGEPGTQIINFLGDQHNVSEFIIADKLKLDMQTVRNTLYRLHTHNVATYIRKKDRQKGWYISYWTFNKKRIKDLMLDMKKLQLDKLKERLKQEETHPNNFFMCPKGCARLDFDQATEFEFKCPECGTLLNQQENSRTIENIKEKIKELECALECSA